MTPTATAAQPLHERLSAAEAALRAHLASWEYAYAMGSPCQGGAEHPTLRAARARAGRLGADVDDLRAQVSRGF